MIGSHSADPESPRIRLRFPKPRADTCNADPVWPQYRAYMPDLCKRSQIRHCFAPRKFDRAEFQARLQHIQV